MQLINDNWNIMILACAKGIQVNQVGRISWKPIEMFFENNWNAFLWVSPIKHKKHTKEHPDVVLFTANFLDQGQINHLCHILCVYVCVKLCMPSTLTEHFDNVICEEKYRWEESFIFYNTNTTKVVKHSTWGQSEALSNDFSSGTSATPHLQFYSFQVDW